MFDRRRVIVCDQHKIVYVRVPKSANTSLRLAFEDGRKRKVSLARLRRKYPTHLSFSFVRNPWSRLFSAWRDKIALEPINDRYYVDGVHHGFVKLGFPFRAGMPFGEFAEFACSVEDADTEKHLKSQSYFLVHDGEVVPEFIGRVESMAEDWDALCGRIGTEIDLSHSNRKGKRGGATYLKHYSPPLAKRVGDRYATDIEQFGYRLEG